MHGKARIYAAIAKLYFCFYSIREYDKKSVLVGTDINRQFAKSMIESTITAIERAAKIQSKLIHGRVMSEYIISFQNGSCKKDSI